MIKRKSRINAYSLIEMLLVMAILVIFGAFGVGGFVGFRETMFVRENVETLKQEILLAQQKAMLLERGIDDTWIYGVGLDFSDLQNGSYKMFRWCSPFNDFGDPTSTSALPGWVPDKEIGAPITSVSDVLGIQDITFPREQIIRPPITIPDPINPPVLDDDDSGTCTFIRKEPCCPTDDKCTSLCYPAYPSCCTVVPDTRLCDSATSCTILTGKKCCPTDTACITSCVETPPTCCVDVMYDDSLCETVDEDIVLIEPIVNGYLPLERGYAQSCEEGFTSLVEITGDASDKFTDAGKIQLLGVDVPIQYLVFEAVTGKAFLYDANGMPVNYSSTGVFDNTDLEILDIVITRSRSSKFDVLSVYPSSGTIVHHVYSNEDLATVGEEDIIVVNGKTYKRFGIFDDINSYRE